MSVLKSATADLDFISLIFETEVIWCLKAMYLSLFQRDFFDAKIGYSEIDDEFFHFI